MNHSPICLKIITVLFITFVTALGRAAWCADDYYTEPQVYYNRPDPGREKLLGPIGVTGITATIHKGVKVTVDDTTPGTPADGKFEKGEVIVGVNGKMLQGRNPLPILGAALTEAEATDGKLTFDLLAKTGAARQVTIKIPVLGPYSKTFPLGSAKSAKIIQDAAAFYAQDELLEGHTILTGQTALFLLSTGDDQYVPVVKKYFAQFLNEDGSAKQVAGNSWHSGPNGVACAEYYLRTGDKSVLPLLQHYCDDARDRQRYGIGWGHWGSDANPAYEGGGGMQHYAGNPILLTLVLGKVCGVDVDDDALLGALRHWYRFIGHGAIPISDQRNWGAAYGSAGRDGMTAAVMQVASLAEGDTRIYTNAKQYLARSALTTWQDGFFAMPGRHLGGGLMHEQDPQLYYQTMQRFQWMYDLRRLPSGAFWIDKAHDSLPSAKAGVTLAFAYTAPLKTLCITGAPRSKFAKPFTLPAQLWGNEADLAFLAAEHHPDYYKYGKDEEIVVPWRLLPKDLRYAPGQFKDVPLQAALKYVHHARYVVRNGAAKVLCFNGHYDEIEKLLRDPDPRLRRAALDGINDCRQWFTGHPNWRYPLPAEKYTPGMCDAITAILNNPDESWYVTDGALLALAHAPIEVLEQNIPKIIPWTKHEEWWLRESAFWALMGLERDQALFVKYLPVLFQTMTNEYRYNPRHKMNTALEGVLAKTEPGDPMREQLVAGFTDAAMNSTVLPDVGSYTRSKEGNINIAESALASIEHAPEGAADLAEALVKADRLTAMRTPSLMNLIKSHPAGAKHYVGLLPALKTLPSPDKKRLTAILYDVVRPELIRRLADESKPNSMINTIVALTQLRRDVPGWQPIGTPKPAERVWRYRSFGPLTEKEELPLNVGAPHRLRDITLAADMKGWTMPGYDDSRWPSGLAPIGKGVFKAHGHGRGHAMDPDFAYDNKSEWGKGEFIAMRTTFTATDEDLNKDYYRLRILSPQGYRVYLNGHKIHSYVWFHNTPSYVEILLGPGEVKHLKKGVNTLAVQGVVRYDKDRKTGEYNEMAQMDVYLDALDKADLGM
jgi:hypothetical protein